MDTGRIATIIGLVIILIFWIISGFLSKDLQRKKGYNGGFWIGFLLGIFSLIYSAGLPDISKNKEANKAEELQKDQAKG